MFAPRTLNERRASRCSRRCGLPAACLLVPDERVETLRPRAGGGSRGVWRHSAGDRVRSAADDRADVGSGWVVTEWNPTFAGVVVGIGVEV
jgi:hypothetical protein